MANITSKTELAETPADGDLLYLVDVSDTTDNANGSDKKVTRANLVGGLQAQPAEGAFVDGDKTKLDGIETGATADQTANEILTAIKTVDGTTSGLDADLLDGNEATAFATSAQGALADTALQPTDIASSTITPRTGAVNLSGGSDGDVLTVQADGSLAIETPSAGGGGGATEYFNAYKNSNQTLNTSGWQQITFLTETYDEGTNFASSTFTAPSNGLYQFTVQLSASAGTTTAVKTVSIRINTTDWIVTSWKDEGTGYGGTLLIRMSASDTAKVYVYNNSGGPTIYSGNGYTYFTGWRVGD